MITLSFVSLHPDHSVETHWAPDRSGDYPEQCMRGRAYADELVAHIQAENDPTMFGAVVRAIVAGRKYEGVEVGFCAGIGIELLGIVE